MRLQFAAHIVVLEFRFRVLEPDDVFAAGVDEEVAVGVADGAVALVDFFVAFGGDGRGEGDGVFYVGAVAGGG